MKNLKLSTELSVDIPLQLPGKETLQFCSFHIERSRLFFASSAGVVYSIPLPSSQNESSWSKSILPEAEFLNLEPEDCITAMDYLMEKEALLVGTSKGYLTLYNTDSRLSEDVGKVEGGVQCIASSPDGALLAVTSGLGRLLVMTYDWEVLYESALDPELSHDGLTGSPDNTPSDPLESAISWRGDGKYFATLSGLLGSSMKKLNIWERESGKMHSTSGSKAFMFSSLDWMPNGAKVAAAYDRKFDNKSPLIVFFEKNGLERSSFALDGPTEASIEILKWNCSSDLLAAKISCDDHDALRIWSFSNNHWYLKQEIRFSKNDVVKFSWDPIMPFHLICWTLGSKVISYNFIWVAAVTESSIGLVIDSSNILVTPLSFSLIPPPMSLFNLNFHCAVQDLAFLSKSSKNLLASSLSDGSLCVVELPNVDSLEEYEGKHLSVSGSKTVVGALMHLTWLNANVLLGAAPSLNNNSSSTMANGKKEYDHQNLDCSQVYSLHELELFRTEGSLPASVNCSGWQTKSFKSVSLERPILSIVPNPAKRHSALIQIEGGSILEYSSDSHLLSNLKNEFTSSCPWMKAVLVSDRSMTKTFVVGLDDRGRLHIGKKVLCSACSSFTFYSNASSEGDNQVMTHLLFTTKQDLLFIIRIEDILNGTLEIDIERYSSSNAGGYTNGIALWERGAKIIGVINGDEAAVILQAPRGNLECIYPRGLVLESISNALVQKRFRDAMLMVRRHRIDFNFLVDYCGWQAFLKLSKEFVTQVNNLNHITEFVCSINNENVMETLYKSYISSSYHSGSSSGPSEYSQEFRTMNKVTSVLIAVRKALEECLPESPARELCMLTTLARSNPPALEEALNRIKLIREMELLEVDNVKRKSYPSAEESLKHLLWLSDPEAVFESALGLYDLNLAAIVALNSQKDPKEFLPFLRELEQLPPAIMRYKIDLRLHRFESALKNIIIAGDDYYKDYMDLMKSHPELFARGLELLTDVTKRYQVLEAWGDYLHDIRSYEDAATAYLCCSSFQKAMKEYRASGNWKGFLTVAAFVKLSKDEVLQLANELCEEFQALGKPVEAAKIALEYCGDVARCVSYFIAAHEWEDALRIASLYEREDLISDVKSSALDSANALILEYTEGSEKVGKYTARYLAVRQRRLVLAAKLQAEDRERSDMDYDIVSEVSTSFSDMSAYTMRTRKDSGASISSSTASKARLVRSQKKKGNKIRAGSPGEEFALVEHLNGIALSDNARNELKSLLRTLITFGKEETARQVQLVAQNFEICQQAAVRLAEETSANDIIDESTQTLENYKKKITGKSTLDCIPWLSKVLLAS